VVSGSGSGSSSPSPTDDPNADGKLRVGIIGCGAGVFHLEGYQEEPRARVVALAGLDTDRCRTLAGRFDVPRIYREYQELLADPSIDAVSVAVPNHLHLPVVKAAVEAGKHVLVEKPLARNAAEGQQMVDAARKAERLLAICFNRRHRHDVELLHAHVAAGGFGRVYYAKAFWMRRSGIPGLGTWFTSKEQAGGGPLIDLGVHVLDMALWTMGNPTVVAVSAATFAEIGTQGKGNWPGRRSREAGDGAYEVEDLATAFVRMEDGAVLHLETSWAAYTSAGDDFGITLMGSKGGAEIYAKDYALTGTLKTFGDFEGVPLDGEPRLVKKGGHAEVIKRFVTSILEGKPAEPSGEEGLDRARLVDAIYRSAELGREVRLDEVAP
jgi:predicted dehydrogenase